LNHKALNDNKLTITYYKLTQDRNNKTNFYKFDLLKTKKGRIGIIEIDKQFSSSFEILYIKATVVVFVYVGSA
jgi:hypothetical protein